MAVSGDTAVVGRRGNSGDAAYHFQRNRGGADNWGEANNLTASDAAASYDFGWSVAVSGDTAVVGASDDDAGGVSAGAAYVFQNLLPVDTDGDGCSNQREKGSDETQGGLRNPLNEWDFYDVAGLSGATPDGVIDLLFDILGVINHYSPTGAPPYDVHYDRGPSAGPNAWNMTAPDGVIDLLNDILGVIGQHGHDCR